MQCWASYCVLSCLRELSKLQLFNKLQDATYFEGATRTTDGRQHFAEVHVICEFSHPFIRFPILSSLWAYFQLPGRPYVNFLFEYQTIWFMWTVCTIRTFSVQLTAWKPNKAPAESRYRTNNTETHCYFISNVKWKGTGQLFQTPISRYFQSPQFRSLAH